MHQDPEPRQRVSRLADLDAICGAIERCAPAVGSRSIELAGAAGRILAEDVRAGRSLPPLAIALRDGWAAPSALLADASPYAPAPLPGPPSWVEAGDPLPDGCDAVLPADALSGIEAIAPVGPGEGVLPAAFDMLEGMPLCRAGAALRAVDVALLRAAGVERVAVRLPRIDVICANARVEDFAAAFIVASIAALGGDAVCVALADGADGLAQSLGSANGDAIIVIGGSGEGRRDRTVETLRRLGDVLIHGMAIRRGETAGFGRIGARPVLLLPGRFDGLLAAWLLVGRHLVTRLTGACALAPCRQALLARKLVSPIGLAEAALVRNHPDGVEPIAGGALPLHALAQAAGWVLVPPGSEGYAAGALVDVRLLA